MKKSHVLFTLLLSFVLVISGCTPFSYLTHVDDDTGTGPTASDCGSCHILQFAEWSLSLHSRSFSNPVFRDQYMDAGDEECLTCHAPVGIRANLLQPRPYNREGGIDCISCHFSAGKMYGPHDSSALFQPHPIEKNDRFYRGNGICSGCHRETADEYPDKNDDTVSPGCITCHAVPVTRTVSQGTGIFTRALVSFEDRVKTYSHEISLPVYALKSSDISVVVEDSGPKSVELTITVTNRLPHNLPTGTYGEKKISLRAEFSLAGEVVEELSREIADETKPLLPGAAKTLHFRINQPPGRKTAVRILLERTGGDDSSRIVAETADLMFFQIAEKNM